MTPAISSLGQHPPINPATGVGSAGHKKKSPSLVHKIRKVWNECKTALDPTPTLGGYLKDMEDDGKEKKEPVWTNWGLAPSAYKKEEKIDYFALYDHTKLAFGLDFTEHCLRDETERVAREIGYQGRTNLFHLVEELRKKENFSQQEYIDNQTPICFSKNGMIQIQHDPKGNGKKDVQTLFYLTARTFGKELADALFIRYKLKGKSHITFLDCKNILAGIDANVRFSDLKRLFDHIHRENDFLELKKTLSDSIQRKIEKGEDLTPKEWEDIHEQAEKPYRWKEVQPSILLAGFLGKEPLLGCRELLLPEDKNTLLAKKHFDDLTTEEITLLLQAYRGVRRTDEEGKPFFASYAQWLFQNEMPKFFGRDEFDTVHHDREMAQALSRLTKEVSYTDNPIITARAMAEKLAREYIYFETRMGHVLPYIEKDRSSTYITVMDEFDRDGVHAKLFSPPYPEKGKYDENNLLPVHIAFRGTQLDHYISGSFESIQRDVDFLGVGQRSFNRCKKDLRNMIVNFLESCPSDHIELCIEGHSLGGTDLQRMALLIVSEYNKALANVHYPHRDAWLKIRKMPLHPFNSPGVGSRAAREWKREVGLLAKRQAPLKITWPDNFVRCKKKKKYMNDIIQEFGGPHIGFDCQSNENFTRHVIIHTIPEQLSKRALHSANVYSASAKNIGVTREVITDEYGPQRQDRILGGSYFVPDFGKNKTKKFLYNVKWLTGSALLPFTLLTKLVFEMLIRLWVKIKRFRYEQKKYEFRPGMISHVLHRMGWKKQGKLRIHPSYFY